MTAPERQRPARADLETVLARLEAMEWRPERNMAGGMTPFCPICGGTPGVYKQNPKTARPDGHWLSGIVRGECLPAGGCPLAEVLDICRAALAAISERTERGPRAAEGGEG